MQRTSGYQTSNGKMFNSRVLAIQEEVRDFMHPSGHANSRVSASTELVAYCVQNRKELIAILEQMDQPEATGTKET